MEFESQIQEATFHSPLEDFQQVTEDVEVRIDPLTGRSSRIADGAFFIPENYEIGSVVTDAEDCFFCPDTVEDATPTYAGWMDASRISRGEAVSFPNLNPYGGYSNVIVLTETHFQPMDEFSVQQLADGFRIAFEYIRAVQSHDPDVTWASVNMNFLRSAGSSLIHPHMQTLVDSLGTNEQRLLLDSTRSYNSNHGSTYWRDLVDEERNGERWIGSTPGVEWLAPWAPKHHRQVFGIMNGVDRIPAPSADVVTGLANGLTAVLDAYSRAGLNAFNFALHLPAAEAMPPVLSIIARSVFDEYYWSDSPFFTVLHDEGVIVTPPEAYAADIRARI